VPGVSAALESSATGCTPQPDDPEADARAKAFFARMIREAATGDGPKPGTGQ
jgi:hypothetical protein